MRTSLLLKAIFTMAIILVPITARVSCASPPSGAVSWWGGEGNPDDSISGHHGTLINGVTYSGGKFGQAFQLNGTDQAIAVPDGIVPSTSRYFTVSAWVNADSVTGAHYIFYGGANAGEYVLSVSDGTVYMHVDLASAGWRSVSSQSTIAAGSWHHITGVRRGTSIEIWVDGELKGSSAIPDEDLRIASWNPGQFPSRIGAYHHDVNGDMYRWDGLIDEVMIYDRALASKEILRLCDPDGPVAWWKGENDTTDSAGNNDGTLQGSATFATGRTGQAFSLSSVTNDGIAVPSSTDLNPTEAITMSAWIKPTATSNDWPYIIGKRTAPSDAIQYSMTISDDNTFSCDIAGAGVNAEGGTIPLNQWSHVACTYDRNALRLYVNGKQVASAPGNSAIATSSEPVTIGRLDGSNSRNFDGLIDEVKIYNRALSAAEVANGYGMVSWWRGEQNAVDSAGGNHGTWSGTPLYQTGISGDAFSFNGVSSRVVTQDINSDTLSVSFWFKRNSMPHTCGGLVTKMMDGDLSAWAVYLNGDRIHVRTDTTGSGQQYLESSTAFSSGVWYHVAFVYDKVNVRLYVNGALDQTQPAGPTLNGNDYPVTIGSGAGGGSLCEQDSHFDGLIDEVQVRNRALTAGEVRSLYDGNRDFEADPAGTVGPAVSGWTYDFFTMNDSGTHGSNPTADHELATTGSRSFSGSKAVYSRIRTLGGGNQDPDYHYATHLLTADYVSRAGNNLDAVTIWRSDIDYTTSSRWFYWFMVEMSDGANTYSEMLACRDWGGQEGCPGDFQDTHDQSATGFDGQTWYRHRVAVPANLDQSRLKITVRHTERSWDGSSAESSLYYDLLGEETSDGDQTPESFTFADQTGIDPGTLVESNQIPVTGIDVPTAISVTGGEYSINGGAYTSEEGLVSNGQSVRVRLSASSSYGATTNAKLTIGGISDTFSVTTKAIVSVGGTIAANTNWTSNNIYLVNSSIAVNPGATLNIQPGTIVKFGAGNYIEIYGALNAHGTAEAGQIYFTSYRDDSVGGDTNGDGVSAGAHSDWTAFFVYAGGSISLDHSVVRYAGSYNSGRHAIRKMNDPGTLSVTNSVISNNFGSGIFIDGNSQGNLISGNTFSSNTGDGIYLNNVTGATIISDNQFSGNGNGLHLTNCSPTISGNTFTGNTGYGLHIDGATIPASVVSNSFTNNGTGPIAMDANGSGTLIDGTNNLNGKGLHVVGGTMTVDRTWASPHPYYITSGILINASITHTIQPGTIVKVASGWYIEVNGTLNAAGSAGAGQIYFTSYRDDSVGGNTDGDNGQAAPCDWAAFFVYAGGSISLNHSVVRYAGASNSGRYAIRKMNDPGSLSVTNSVISNNFGGGIFIDGNSQGNMISGNTFNSNTGDGIYLNNVTGATIISDNQFSDNGNGLHSINSSPAITANNFTGNNYGLYVEGATIPVAVTGVNEFSGNTTGPIAMDANGSGTLIDGTNNLNGKGLHVVGGTMTVDRTWASPHPYYITSGILINASITHTIQPGTIVKVASGWYIEVNGTLNAAGNAGAGQIYFTSYRDDSVGGDTNGDGATTPAPGDWTAFFVYAGGSISLDHSVVRYAGASNSGRYAIRKMNNPGTLNVTNSVISNNFGGGIFIDGNSQGNEISGNTISSNSGAGIYLNNATGGVGISRNRITGNNPGIFCSASNPVIGGTAENGNDIFDNTGYGVQNISALTVNATHNWWGSATGPTHSSNPSGSGNAVSDYVDFSNFLPYWATYIDTLTINFSGSGAGAVTVPALSLSCSTSRTEQVHRGHSLTLQAQPTAADSVFSGWSGGICSGTEPCTFSMNGDATVTATFTAMPPIADFSATPLSGYEPLLVSFTDLSTRGPSSWQWSFGDSGTSALRNPSHLYMSPGTYAVSLTANNANGADSETKSGYITVTACPNGPASLLPTFYGTLQEAYNNASNGSMIRGRYKALGGVLDMGQDRTVFLYGGYDCLHQNRVGVTTIGTLQITRGTAVVQDIVIR